MLIPFSFDMDSHKHLHVMTVEYERSDAALWHLNADGISIQVCQRVAYLAHRCLSCAGKHPCKVAWWGISNALYVEDDMWSR